MSVIAHAVIQHKFEPLRKYQDQQRQQQRHQSKSKISPNHTGPDLDDEDEKYANDEDEVEVEDEKEEKMLIQSRMDELSMDQFKCDECGKKCTNANGHILLKTDRIIEAYCDDCIDKFCPLQLVSDAIESSSYRRYQKRKQKQQKMKTRTYHFRRGLPMKLDFSGVSPFNYNYGHQWFTINRINTKRLVVEEEVEQKDIDDAEDSKQEEKEIDYLCRDEQIAIG